ncbi:MAG: hypothetical protein J7K15_10355 [Deltaproteobacteria bacterium]|nr:hypothetical protein [Deltaproteobacteria bacterium]
MFCRFLADKVIQMYEDVDAFLAWLRDLERTNGFKVRISDGYIAVQGQITVGLSPMVEPPLNYVMLVLAVFGEVGVYLPDFGDGYEAVNKWWRENKDRLPKLVKQALEKLKQHHKP